MTAHYLEDFAVGQTYSSGRVRVDADRIKSFAAEFDSQPFHVDEEAAKHSFFHGLAASGWHTAGADLRSGPLATWGSSVFASMRPTFVPGRKGTRSSLLKLAIEVKQGLGERALGLAEVVNPMNAGRRAPPGPLPLRVVARVELRLLDR